jgi:FkbM family methyltransferase
MDRVRRRVARRLAPFMGSELAPHIIREIDARVAAAVSAVSQQIVDAVGGLSDQLGAANHRTSATIEGVTQQIYEVDRRASAAIEGLLHQVAEVSRQLTTLQMKQAELVRAQAKQQESDLIYDIGMNNGDDCEYYLAKGYRVIGIEAEPKLCAQAMQRFSSEIAAGRLKIVNTAIGDTNGTSNFFVNAKEPVWSTLTAQDTSDGEWRAIPVPICRLSSLINEYGYPYYIKIDIEGYDPVALQDLYEQHIIPSFISAECHQIEVLCRLAAMGYRKFKLIACHQIDADYHDHTITTRDGSILKFSFKYHSSGPFGTDIPGPWVCLEDAIRLWLERDPSGWYDFHAMKG